MKIFEFQRNLMSFSYPVAKIIGSLSVIIITFLRDQIFRFSNLWVKATVALLCVSLSIASILCIYISIVEIFQTYCNRKNLKYQPSSAKPMTIEEVAKIVSENDIVEIEACIDNKAIKIGASAECKYSSSVFENKLFYISTSEYETVELFTKALNEVFPKGIIPVSKIDDLPLV